MGLPRPPLTSTSSVVWWSTALRAPSIATTSPQEPGQRSHRCHFPAKHPRVPSTHLPTSSIARTDSQTTDLHPTTSQPTPGRHWLPIPLPQTTGALHRVLSTARCLSRAAPALKPPTWTYTT